MGSRMKDVADRVGVSVTTVSHVMNKTRYVAPETRRRVLDAIRELNYYKNAHARRLARGRSDFLGLMISDIENPVFPELIKSFETAAAERGFDLLLCTTNYDPDRTRAVVRKMIENKVPGVAVMTSGVGMEVAGELAAHQVAVVFLDLGPARKYISNIRVNYAQGISQAINHLHDLGHQAFAFIAGPQNRRSAAKYQNAVIDALQQRGLASPRIVEGNQKMESGVAAIRSLLAQPDFPTAILCINDLTAIGAILALREAGVRVPEDVSVIGSEDIYFARVAHPPLTTVRLARDRLGRLAFEALEKMLRSQRRRGGEYVLETQLVIRQSTGSVRKPDLQASAPHVSPPSGGDATSLAGRLIDGLGPGATTRPRQLLSRGEER